MRFVLRCLVLFLSGGSLLSAVAHAGSLSFDTYAAGTRITTQYAGLTVSGATVLAPGSMAPAHSGSQELVSGTGQPIALTFTDGQSAVSGFYTSSGSVTVSVFTNRSAKPSSVVTLTPQLRQTAFTVTGSDITKLVLTPTLGHVTLDDLLYAPPASSSATEPGSLLVIGTGLCLSSLLPAWRASQRAGAV